MTQRALPASGPSPEDIVDPFTMTLLLRSGYVLVNAELLAAALEKWWIAPGARLGPRHGYEEAAAAILAALKAAP